MGWLQVVMVLYGLFSILMGAIGFASGGSAVSLYAGGAAGILIIGCAALTKTHPRIGFIAATIIALAMAGQMAKKTFAGTIYPSGIIFAVSLIFALTLLIAHFAAVAKRKRETTANRI